MKNKYIVLCLLSGVFLVERCQTPRTKKAAIAFSNDTLSIGSLTQGEQDTLHFTFVNTGTDTLKIRDVQASCSCTTLHLN